MTRLEKMRKFIASLPIDSMGSGALDSGETYPLRDQVVDELTKEIEHIAELERENDLAELEREGNNIRSLHKRIEELESLLRERTEHPSFAVERNALRGRIAELEAQLRWRPVSEQTPGPGWYLTVLDSGRTVVLHSSPYSDPPWIDSFGGYYQDVAWWMPIPGPNEQ